MKRNWIHAQNTGEKRYFIILKIKKYRSGILVIIYILFGIYAFILSDNGILERIKLIQGKKAIIENIARLERENKNLQNEYSVISNKDTNSGFYKEEASKSGYIKPGEKYIFYKGIEESEPSEKIVKEKKEKYPVKLSHLRILWGVSSIMIILLYFAKRRREKEKQGEENL